MKHTLLRSSPTGWWSWDVPLSDGTFNQHSEMYDRKRHGSTPHVSARRSYKYGITMRDHTINPQAAFKLASQTLSTCFVTDCQAVKLILRILTVVHDTLLIMAGVNRYEEYLGLYRLGGWKVWWDRCYSGGWWIVLRCSFPDGTGFKKLVYMQSIVGEQ